ncbi:MAG: TylF/MycF/NovP-related O-methyltransferase [Sulfuritalea sp.]|nr:TylF/MycF/NovP-related O-methyltransferase [Sulfuritalea sp.]
MSWHHQFFVRPNLVRRLKAAARKLGFDVVALSANDVEPHYFEINDRVEQYTMTSLSRVFAVIAAAEHLSRRSVQGAVVECGVWKGGSTMAALLALARIKDISREVWLYDTYEGMAAPTRQDGDTHTQLFTTYLRADGGSDWCRAELGEVVTNVESCGYPMAKIKFIKGRVEDTIPGNLPDRISLLRLDTDWYESTKHELDHLYPRLVSGGILIIDDYGAFAGAKQAVDEYFASQKINTFLHRIDTTGRLLVKA